jgi:NAD+ diphosphatase
MIGALAVAEENQTIRLDLDNELDQALWVSREAVLQALDKRSNISRIEMQQMESGNPSQSGLVEDMKDVRLPPDSAIAHVLIDSWARGTWKRPSPSK